MLPFSIFDMASCIRASSCDIFLWQDCGVCTCQQWGQRSEGCYCYDCTGRCAFVEVAQLLSCRSNAIKQAVGLAFATDAGVEQIVNNSHSFGL